MDGMGVSDLLPFVAAQPLVDHHCHGLLGAGGGSYLPGGQSSRTGGSRPPSPLAPVPPDLAGLLNEADGAAAADGMPFDSLAGLALRRWCPPLLGLPPHASVDSYAERRAALGRRR